MNIQIENLIKKHGSLITINTNNIKENYKILQDTAPNSVISAVIKSDAYGMGLLQITKILLEVNCNDFFVATLDEALEVRKIAETANIYVLHGIFENTQNIFLENNIIPVINSLKQLSIWLNFAKEQNSKLSCILHVDTGINRLGLQKEELHNIYNDYDSLAKFLDFKYIMSHFACSDDETNPANNQQYENFLNICNNFPADIKKSLAASYAMFNNKDYHFDMIRPGFVLYGSNPTPNKPNPLKPVIEFYTTILKINYLEPNETIGYGYTWQSKRKSIVGTVTIGYADGILRSSSNSGNLYISGQKVPIIGRISMDSLMVDLTDVKDVKLEEGTIVEVIGKNQDIDQFSLLNKSIQCEALNLLSTRYPRVYY